MILKNFLIEEVNENEEVDYTHEAVAHEGCSGDEEATVAEGFLIRVLFNVATALVLSLEHVELSGVPDVLAFKLFHFPLVLRGVFQGSVSDSSQEHLHAEEGGSQHAHDFDPFQL